MRRHNTKPYRSNSFIRMLAVMPCLLLLLVLGFAMPASASQPNLNPYGNYTSVAAAHGGGFWIQMHAPGHMAEYRTVAIDGAPQYDTVNEPGSITAIPGTNKYWVVTTNGMIFDRGGAPYLCEGRLANCSGFRSANRSIMAAAASPRGDGLWAVDDQGAVWTAGNTVSYGDAMHDSRYTPTGIAATPSGNGYYIVMNNGGVHARGDAVFYGSTGGNRPGGHDLVGIALSHDITGAVNGYWLVGSDGGVHTFGNALSLGSTGGSPGRGAVSNITGRSDGRSYAWVYADGRVGKSGDAPPFVVTSVTQGKAIEVPNGSMALLTPLQLATTNGSSSQKWHAVRADGPSMMVQLVNANSGLCMDLEGGHSSGRVIQYPCKTETPDFDWANQLWHPVKDESGAIQFQSLQQPGHRLYGYPDEYGAGLTVSYYTNNSYGFGWTVTPAP
ncbi:MAG TPA: RICIN domain-containing protein [Terriglobales bacterium]|nr:RICIN domain-containing protein [Terriglobales bacterium]